MHMLPRPNLRLQGVTNHAPLATSVLLFLLLTSAHAMAATPATPVITWANPATIYYGTALSSTQLNASANVPGTFTYSPGSGTVLGAGSRSLNATFTPTDTTNYTTAYASVTLSVAQAQAMLSLCNLSQTFDGTQKSVTATSYPSGVYLSVTYSQNGQSAQPRNAGSYSVQATVQDANYWGSAYSTLTIMPAQATVMLSNLNQTFNGMQKSVTSTSYPSGLMLSVTYSQNGQSAQPRNAGSYTVQATVQDANYWGSASSYLTITPVTPVITWAKPADIWYGTALSSWQLNATASVGGTNLPGMFTYQPGTGTWLSAGQNQTLSVTFWPTDGVNYTTASATTTITVLADSTPPVISGLSPTAGFATRWPPGIAGGITDSGSGVNWSTLSVSLNGMLLAPSVYGTWFYCSTPSYLADGAYIVQVSVYDNSYNRASAQTTFILDTTAPAVTINYPPDGFVTRILPTVTGQATDSLSGVNWATLCAILSAAGAQNGIQLAPSDSGNTFSFSLPANLADGYYVVAVNVEDNVGNPAQAAHTTFTLDTTPPTITLSPTDITVEATGPNGATVTYTAATATDNLSAPTITYSQASGNVFPLGTTPVTVTATDAGGNSAQTSFNVTVQDTTPPVISAPDIFVQTPNPVGVVVDFIGLSEVDNISTAPSWFTWPSSGDFFPVGTTTVYVWAFDDAGNGSDTTFNVTVQCTSPIITPLADVTVAGADANGGTVNYPPAVVTSLVSQNLTVTYSQNSGTTFPVGMTIVTVTAADDQGHTSTASFYVTILDPAAPTISATISPAPNAAGWNNTGVTVSFQATASVADLDSVSDPVILTSEGEWSGTGVATDLAGYTATVQVAVFIDKTPPTIVNLADPPATGAETIIWPQISDEGSAVNWSTLTVCLNGTQLAQTITPVGYVYLPPSDIANGANSVQISLTIADYAGNIGSSSWDLAASPNGIPPFAVIVPCGGLEQLLEQLKAEREELNEALNALEYLAGRVQLRPQDLERLRSIRMDLLRNWSRIIDVEQRIEQAKAAAAAAAAAGGAAAGDVTALGGMSVGAAFEAAPLVVGAAVGAAAGVGGAIGWGIRRIPIGGFMHLGDWLDLHFSLFR